MHREKNSAWVNVRKAAAAALGVLSLAHAITAAASCEALAKFPVANATITAAVTMPANSAIDLPSLTGHPLIVPVAFCVSRRR